MVKREIAFDGVRYDCKSQRHVSEYERRYKLFLPTEKKVRISVVQGRSCLLCGERMAEIREGDTFTELLLSSVPGIDGKSVRMYCHCPHCGRCVRYLYDYINKLPDEEICAILRIWETIEPGGCPHFGGANPPDERKEGDAMYVTYSDLIQIGIFICALVGLCYTIFKGKRK